MPPPPSFDADELRRLQALERVNRLLVGSSDLEGTLNALLDELLDLFDCDRAFVLDSCDPAEETFRVRFERTRPEWPGALALGVDVPKTGFGQVALAMVAASDGAVRFDPECNPVPDDNPTMAQFVVRSQLLAALRVPDGSPWCLGIHHCREARTYGPETVVMTGIAGRIADALGQLLQSRELERSRAFFQTLLDYAPEAIVLLDVSTGRFIEVNRNAEQLFGWSREELLQLGPADTSPVMQPDGRLSSDVAFELITSAVGGAAPVFEWMHLNARGEQIPCEVRLVRMPHENRIVVRGSVIDQRDRKRAEERQRALEAQLRHVQKMEALGQLTGGVAHDFNNLLTVILGNTEFAKSLLPEGHAAAELLEDSLQAVRKGALLTQRLLAFSRRQALVPTSLHPGALVRGMEAMLARTLGETIRIETVVGAGLWNCEVDRSQLENAILNLAINARDAMPDGGSLTIDVANAHLDDEYCAQFDGLGPGQYVVLAISDDGTGMAPEVLEQAFEPFFTTKDVGRGSGLGLSMVYGFVKQSGGHVRLYSELGHGTTVRLYLPRADRPADEVAPSDNEHIDVTGKGEWILVVEDDDALRGFIKNALSARGYRVHEAGSAAEALKLLERKVKVDLMLTDVVLPGGVNGAELARRVTADRPGLRVLFMSGYTENAIIHHGRLDPGVELLSKPFSRQKLERSVRRMLDRKPG